MQPARLRLIRRSARKRQKAAGIGIYFGGSSTLGVSLTESIEDWISFCAASTSALIVCMDGSMARRTSLAASRKVRSASPMPEPSFSRSFELGALLAGAAGGGCIPAASNAWRSIVEKFASDCCAGSCLAFKAACWAMTRSTAALFTTALKPEDCAGAAGAAPGVPGLGVPAGDGGATGGGVTGFQACCATMYAVVPGVAADPVCGGTGDGAAGAACAVVAAGCGVGLPDGCGGGTGWGPPGTTWASTACACSGA